MTDDVTITDNRPCVLAAAMAYTWELLARLGQPDRDVLAAVLFATAEERGDEEVRAAVHAYRAGQAGPAAGWPIDAAVEHLRRLQGYLQTALDRVLAPQAAHGPRDGHHTSAPSRPRRPHLTVLKGGRDA